VKYIYSFAECKGNVIKSDHLKCPGRENDRNNADKMIRDRNNVERIIKIGEICWLQYTLVSCWRAHLVRSAPVFCTDSAVRVKSTAITSSHPLNFDLNICTEKTFRNSYHSAIKSAGLLSSISSVSLFASILIFSFLGMPYLLLWRYFFITKLKLRIVLTWNQDTGVRYILICSSIYT
jgi:hypothetical protein